MTGRVANGTVLGLITGLLYTDIDVSQLGPWLCIMITVPATSSTVMLSLFFNDRPFMNMERSAGLYHTLPYYLAQFCTSVLAGSAGNFAFIFVAFCFSGLPWEVFLGTYAFEQLIFFTFDAILALCVYACSGQTQVLVLIHLNRDSRFVCRRPR